MNLQMAMDKMRTSGYKITEPRKEIFYVLELAGGEHLSPEDIHQRLSFTHPEIGIATIYRTLLLFEQLEIVQKHKFDDNRARYELVSMAENHHHHHLICSHCGVVVEVRLDLLDDLEDKIEKNHGFRIENHDLKFYGICKKCLDKNKGDI
ncbi:MAG: Fur family transcriptional regulator [Tissierellia bacterium]|nr:Fur family transcriptional regulator [Tissierellia bacterium]